MPIGKKYWITVENRAMTYTHDEELVFGYSKNNNLPIIVLISPKNLLKERLGNIKEHILSPVKFWQSIGTDKYFKK